VAFLDGLDESTPACCPTCQPDRTVTNLGCEAFQFTVRDIPHHPVRKAHAADARCGAAKSV